MRSKRSRNPVLPSSPSSSPSRAGPSRSNAFVASEGWESLIWDRFPVRFDAIEIYAGCARWSKAMASVAFVVMPLDKRVGWNLLDPLLIVWLTWMISLRRVGLLFWSPPCTGGSIAKHPLRCAGFTKNRSPAIHTNRASRTARS